MVHPTASEFMEDLHYTRELLNHGIQNNHSGILNEFGDILFCYQNLRGFKPYEELDDLRRDISEINEKIRSRGKLGDINYRTLLGDELERILEGGVEILGFNPLQKKLEKGVA